MASNKIKLFVVSEDSTTVEKIQQWANIYDHEGSLSTNSVKFFILIKYF
jgi:hypothetical protein